MLGIPDLFKETGAPKRVEVRATRKDGTAKQFDVIVRIDTPQEALYYANGGILQYVLRQLMAGSRETVGAYGNR